MLSYHLLLNNGIYSDTTDALTTELFTAAGYVVTVANQDVLFEPLPTTEGWSSEIIPKIPSYRPMIGETSTYGY